MANAEQLEILKQGVEVWNTWREENPHVPIDLAGAELMGAHLENANLSHARLDGANLSYAHLENANLVLARLEGANLFHARLAYANLAHARLEKANLVFAHLEGSMLPFAHLAGANFSAANLKNTFAEDADFHGANLSYAHLEQAMLACSNFKNVNLLGAHLEGANISAVNLEKVNVSWVKYDRKILWKALREERGNPVALWKKRQDLLLDTSIRCKGVNAATCYGSQQFKLFLHDQDFLEESLETSWGKRRYVLWWLLADCGRSLGRWANWCVLIAILFAGIYQLLGQEQFSTVNLDFSFFSLVYYSTVTFTTLGFGDFVPKTQTAALFVAAEVIMGYIMLGGLISILSGRLARRGG
jgi:hypothetical protein